MARMEHVLDVYKRPYDPMHPVVCMDESPRQLIRETRLPLPGRPGAVERFDYEYERCGVCSIFMAVEPLAGKRIVKVKVRRTKKDWALFLNGVAHRYCEAEKITLVMDNLNTHSPGSFYETFSPVLAKGSLGSLRVCLHPEAWQLAEHCRDRDQRSHPTVPGPTDRYAGRDAGCNSCLGEAPKQRGITHRLAVHQWRCPHQVEEALPDTQDVTQH